MNFQNGFPGGPSFGGIPPNPYGGGYGGGGGGGRGRNGVGRRGTVLLPSSLGSS